MYDGFSLKTVKLRLCFVIFIVLMLNYYESSFMCDWSFRESLCC